MLPTMTARARAVLVVAMLVAGCSAGDPGPGAVTLAPSIGTGIKSPAAPTTPVTPATSAPPLRIPNGVTADIDVREYPVAGDTREEVLDAMRAHNLRDPTGAPSLALTTWYISWSYAHVAGSAGCSIDDVKVDVEIDILHPAWNPPANAPPSLVESWQRFTDALAVHERSHAQNALDHAGDLAAALRILADAPTCASLDGAAEAIGQSTLDAARAWDREYDERTLHGATEGAAF